MPRHYSTLKLMDLFHVFCLVCCISYGGAQTENDFAETPKIVTQDGNLVFMSAQRHNITFRSPQNGFINLNGDNLLTVVQMVKDNTQDLDQLKAGQGDAALISRLEAVEQRLDSLEPTGQVQEELSSLNEQLATLTQRLQALEEVTQAPSQVDQLRRQVRAISRSLAAVRRQYSTLNLQLRRNECDSAPCENGGSCLDLFNGFACTCTKGWTGDTCEEDVNECYTLTGTDLGCQNGGTCTNTPGSFVCTCPPDKHGVLCTSTVDDCSGGSSEALCGHGTCVNVPRTQDGQARYTCICDSGWTTSGTDPACNTDVDECTADNLHYPCSANPHVGCINYDGGFRCMPCPDGYTGNGRMCTDIDECAVSNGGCSLSPRVQCINTVGSRTCGNCPAGYTGDGVVCTYGGVCSLNNGGCSAIATCIPAPNTVQGRVCVCPQGYAGHGVGANGCTQQAGGCQPDPCAHGQCVAAGGSYSCVCEGGWAGVNCDQPVNACASAPCHHGGTCTNAGSGYTCECTDEWTGDRCDQQQQSCGGQLRGDAGTLSYPLDPSQTYPHSVSCAWTISTETANKVLTLNFATFKLEQQANCAYDFLQIHDGPTASSHMIGKFCGDKETLPKGGVINGTRNQLYLWFKSDASNAADGFQLHWTSAPPECGGDLTGSDHGLIQSPGYPGDYPHNRDCVWTIRVSPTKKIQFHFAHLALESHADCRYDFLKIYNGLTEAHELLQTFCHSPEALPAPFTTTGPYARVYFHTDGSNSDTGFSLTYSSLDTAAACGGSYTRDTGVLISPQYPNPYPHRSSCIWTITVPENQVITLNFTDLDLESHDNCRYDYVELRDGTDETGDFIGKYCGSALPLPRQSPGNQLWVKFGSDSSSNGRGFRMTWNVECGGLFTSQTGELTSPYHPANYPHNKECIYRIEQPEGSSITLQFAMFEVESSSGACRHDFLEVRFGNGPDAELFGTYCGSSLPPTIVSPGNQMWLKFKSDSSLSYHGFRATYTVDYTGGGGSSGGGQVTGGGGGADMTTAGPPSSVTPMHSCGGSMVGDSGRFTSPSYPNVYPHGANCTWYITVTPGRVIRMTFTAFNLESHDSCVYDSVTVTDTPEVGQIGRYCGSNHPPVITSSSNVLTVRFRTDSSISRDGFVAEYVSFDASTACGGQRSANTGTISSPNYPENYPHNRDCEWVISVLNRRQVLLNITDLQLESVGSCRDNDYLEVRNGGTSSSPLIGQFCGRANETDTIVSHSNKLYLKFHSDGSDSNRGFQVFYDGTSTGCGGELTSPTGSIISPNYPLPYPSAAECYWTITVSPGNRVTINFDDMDMEGHSTCNYDYVILRDRSSSGSLLGKFCGTSTPIPITSSANVVWLMFRTDYSSAGRGFRLSYTTVCNVRLTAQSGVIESINYPEPYPNNSNCTYILETTRGNHINAHFTWFSLQPPTSDGACADYVQIRDGQTATDQLIGQYCDSTPPAITSTSQYLYIFFSTDSSQASRGFHLEYSFQGCGAYMRGLSGTFSSMNYPNPYTDNRECSWSIEVDPGNRVELSILDQDIEPSPNCSNDALTVYGGMDTSSALMNPPFCGSHPDTQVLTSQGNFMTVLFDTNPSVSGRGFNASYRAISGGCGGNFTAASAHITSPDYPNAYPHNLGCVWYINVRDSHSVKLSISYLEMEGSDTCSYDYLAIHDGNSTSAPQIARLCRSTGLREFTSSGSHMTLRMRSDGSVSRRGFNATYTTICGGTMDTGVDGNISSPGWPFTYAPLTDCSWRLVSSHPGDRVTLTFTNMDLETVFNCSNDYVIVRDGDDIDGPIVGTYCGSTLPSSITSQGSALVVQFHSNQDTAGSGFRAVYTKSTTGCGGSFSDESGAFTSPAYPEQYPADTECIWVIQGITGANTQLTFSEFQLDAIEDDAECSSSNDYIEIRETNSTGEILGLFCGQEVPTNVTRGRSLWVKFISNGQGSGNGFRAQYSTEFGGEIYGTNGTLTSPYYPSSYQNNQHYVWTITVPNGQRISVQFTDFYLESQSICSYDYVLIEDSYSSGSTLGRFCGSSRPSPLVSSSNQIRVTFRTDSSVTYRGFRMYWAATNASAVLPPPTLPPGSGVCGGQLQATMNASVITSPNYPNDYPHGVQCFWQIAAPPFHQIWFNISDLRTEEHYNCNFDYLALYSGTQSTDANLLGKYCGRQVTDTPVLSGSRQMLAKFRSDGSVSYGGFHATYKAVCGGLVSEETGVISSPGESGYGANMNCTWRVHVTPGRTVQLNFTSLQLPGVQGQCAGTYVKIFNGEDTNSPILGEAKYCGGSIPSVLTSNYHRVTVQFVSDSASTSGGFNISYEEKPVACGGTIMINSAAVGYIESPNYPDQYPVNTECIWIITAIANEQVQLDFLTPINMERHINCTLDYVEVRSGETDNGALLGRFCGGAQPDTLKSTANSIYIRMRSDHSGAGTGFRAQYKMATCGGTYSGREGFLQTPNYPASYPNSLDCEWFIRAPTGHYLSFTFITFQTESNEDCTQADYVEIREYNQTGTAVATVCGTTSSVVNTSDSFAYVKFHSNSANQFPGVKIQYQASIETCGGELVTPSGYLRSPNYPGLYPHRRNCVWHIKAAFNRRVTLTIIDLDLEEHDRCAYDFVAIYNGVLRDSPRIGGRLCGQLTNTVIESTGSGMTVQFRTDGSESRGGFRASYTTDNDAVCGGVREASSGVIESPGFSTGGYNLSMECIWAIMVPRSMVSGLNYELTLSMKFDAISLERHGNCAYDHVELREGLDENGHLIGRFCGNYTTLPQLRSPQPAVWVRFVSDIAINDQGFQLSYRFRRCGGLLSASEGIVQSPSYPGNHGNDEDCAWLIFAEEGSRIRITFEDIAIEEHPDCNYDYVEVFNGEMASSPSVGRFCGTTARDPFTSQSNHVRIEWRTDNSGTGRGFQIRYEVITQGCGGLLHGQSGRVHSPNWPSNYPDNTECEWEIEVLPGYHIEYSFNDTYAFPEDCSDNVMISYKTDEITTEVMRYCGQTLPAPARAVNNKMRVKFVSDGSTNSSGFSLDYTSGCGANFSGDSGTIVSPGYPSGYANNLHCNYSIQVDPEDFIVLQFEEDAFHVEGQRKPFIPAPQHSDNIVSVNDTGGKNDGQVDFEALDPFVWFSYYPNSTFPTNARIVCQYDSVRVYAGNTSSARLVGRFCGTTAPQPVSSRGSMRIEFITDESVTDRGWRANYWVRQCGGNFTGQSGEIQTPTHPHTYHHNADCGWLITVREDRVVTLKFTEFELEGTGSCDYDSVSVYDGNSTSAALIGKYCGRIAPPPIQASGRQLYIRFRSDSSVAYKGFHAAYYESFGEAQGCGGTVDALTAGTIQPVDIDSDGVYEPNQDCVWLLQVPSDRVIKIHFNGAFEVEESNCLRYDYLEIRDGISDSDPLVGRYCGDTTPPAYVSSTNYLYVRFISDSSGQGSGFTLSYMAENRTCGGQLAATTSPQNVTSPNYPSHYPSNSNCRWLITAQPPEQILINVLDMDIEDNSACQYDYLELRDQPLGWVGQSHHYCGSQVVPPFKSVGGSVQINMKTDTFTSGSGFRLTYQIASCDWEYTADNGRITSPGYPNYYRARHSCTMVLRVAEGRSLALYFNAFELESHNNCNYDYLMVNASGPISRKLCGSQVPDPIFIANNTATLRFVTDASAQRSGFDITYTSTLAGLGCGGNFTVQNGTFTSPGYPGLNNDTHDCHWIIQVPARHNIRVTFNYIGFANENNDCTSTHLALYAGDPQTASLLLRLCGDEGPTPTPYASSNREIHVVFKSAANSTGQGFRLTYTS